ncbi:MAG: helix-turn-helix transcriptional regulator [Anaerolineales bacterium]|nr:helix-turn-helix transcriptional regulator [Anaerolineales bacterium]
MSITVNEIARRVREARKQRGLTQKDLADHLGRTAAAVSDLERGKVQITATDLMALSKLLEKPIEYFYGEDFLGEDVQDLIAILREITPEEQTNIVSTVKYLRKLQEIMNEMKATDDKEKIAGLLRDFYSFLQPFLEQITSIQATGIEAQQKMKGLLDDLSIEDSNAV